MTDKLNFDELLATHSKRTLQSALFNIACAYNQAGDASWNRLTENVDFAAPSIMCQSFAIELLLKFFLAVDHPSATNTDELRSACVKLKCHKYSELFDQLLPKTKMKIASEFTLRSGKQTNTTAFIDALKALGDEPFVSWRYVYEQDENAYFDRQAFKLITDTLGKVAEAEQKAANS